MSFKWNTFITALTCGIVVSGCAIGATANFAPPIVSNNVALEDLSSGLDLLDRYIEEYRKEGQALANGRQAFDVTGILSGIGGATAVALGANTDVAIGTGALSALAATGKSYYAPNARADAYFDAVSALMCMQQEGIGLDRQFVPAQNTASKAGHGSDEEKLVVSEQKRAFLLFKNGALNVENVLRERLSEKGTVTNAESIAALVKQYQKQIEEARKARSGEDSTQKKLSETFGDETPYEVDLNELAPKLNECALLARG
jgi:hypothetical protein